MSNARILAFPGLVASVFMFVLVPALLSPGQIAAQLAELPAEFYGKDLPDGTEIAARIGGTECDSTVVEDGWWLIRVYPDECDGLAVTGARVTFTVNGVQADQSVIWRVAYQPPDLDNGIRLTVGGGPVTVGPGGPPEPPLLSRTQGLAIFSGGTLDDLEAAALAACPGGVTIWANAPGGDDYLLFRAAAPFPLVNAPFESVYGDGFDGPEPVIVTGCKMASGL